MLVHLVTTFLYGAQPTKTRIPLMPESGLGFGAKELGSTVGLFLHTIPLDIHDFAILPSYRS